MTRTRLTRRNLMGGRRKKPSARSLLSVSTEGREAPVFRGVQAYSCDRRDRAVRPTAVIERRALAGRVGPATPLIRGNTGWVLPRPIAQSCSFSSLSDLARMAKNVGVWAKTPSHRSKVRPTSAGGSGLSFYREINNLIWQPTLSARIEIKGLFRALANHPSACDRQCEIIEGNI